LPLGIRVLINFEIRKKKDDIIYNMENINKDMQDIYKIPSHTITLGIFSRYARWVARMRGQNKELGLAYADTLAHKLYINTTARSCFDTVSKEQLDADEGTDGDVIRTLAGFYDFASRLVNWTSADDSSISVYMCRDGRSAALIDFIKLLLNNRVATACCDQMVHEESRIELYIRNELSKLLTTMTTKAKNLPYLSVVNLHDKMKTMRTRGGIDNFFDLVRSNYDDALIHHSILGNIQRHCIAYINMFPSYEHTQ
jgi:hypothetical protein